MMALKFKFIWIFFINTIHWQALKKKSDSFGFVLNVNSTGNIRAKWNRFLHHGLRFSFLVNWICDNLNCVFASTLFDKAVATLYMMQKGYFNSDIMLPSPCNLNPGNPHFVEGKRGFYGVYKTFSYFCLETQITSTL